MIEPDDPVVDTTQPIQSESEQHNEPEIEDMSKKKPATKTKKPATSKKTIKPKEPAKAKAPKGKPGRKPSEFPGRYQLRHMPDQLVAWMKAAGVTEPGPGLQSWMRKTLDREAARDAAR